MAEKLTWDEIVKLYDREWVLLEDYDWLDEEADPRSGRVIVHAKSRQDFDALLERNDALIGENVAMVFTGRPLLSSTFQGGFRHIEMKLNA